MQGKEGEQFKKSKNRLLTYIGLIVLGFALLIFLKSPVFEKKQTLYTYVIIGNKTGIDLNGSAITFGEVYPGQSLSRGIALRNENKKDSKITILAKGNITDMLVVSENNFILKPKEQKNISFSIAAGELNEPGKYEGEITILSKKLFFR